MNFIKTSPPSWLSGVNVDYYDSIQYGKNNIQNMDIIIPTDESFATPCIINIHGGSFVYGDKTDIWDDAGKQAIVKNYVDVGIAYISINYDLMELYNEKKGIMSSIESCIYALQWIKYHADVFNIDKNNIGFNGGSAGGGIGLWIASSPDLADVGNSNLIKRESTTIVAIATNIAQASYDFQKWEDIIFSSLSYSIEDDYTMNETSEDSTNRSYVISSFEEISTEPTVTLRGELDILQLIDDNGGIPTYLYYDSTYSDTIVNGTLDNIEHSDRHGAALQAALENEGTEVLTFLDTLSVDTTSGESKEDWLIRNLLPYRVEMLITSSVTPTFTVTGGSLDILDNLDGTYLVTGQSGITKIEFTEKSATEIHCIKANNLTDAEEMFYNCALVTDITFEPEFDMSNTTNMNSMFRDCILLNSALNINTSSCLDMEHALAGCTVFNQDISNWDVSNVTNFSAMLQYTIAFNQDIGGWDVSSSTNLGNMLFHAEAFNYDIGSWDVSNVIEMSGLFSTLSTFNSDLNSWDVSNVTNMNGMFFNCYIFNKSLSNWDTSSVLNMGGMFSYATVFNQDISGWDVSSVVNMSEMFRANDDFNQDLSGWDVSSVTDMGGMFRNAVSFDQDLSSWQITQVTDFSTFMQGVTLSTSNYDALLIAWAAQGAMSYTGDVDFGNSVYTIATAGAARTTLEAAWGGTISDGGGI